MRDSRHWKRWHRQDDLVFRTLWAEGVTLDNIAHRLGRTELSVRTRRKKLGLPKRQLPGNGRVAFTVPPDLHRLASRKATSLGMPLSNYVRGLMERDLGTQRPSYELAD